MIAKSYLFDDQCFTVIFLIIIIRIRSKKRYLEGNVADSLDCTHNTIVTCKRIYSIYLSRQLDGSKW